MDFFLGLAVPKVSQQVKDEITKAAFEQVQRFLDDMLVKSKQFAGETVTVTIVTNVRTNGGNLEQKQRIFLFRDGMLMDICNESDWIVSGAV